MTASPTPDRTKAPALAVLFLVVFVNLVGFGLIVPLLPFFGSSLGATEWQVTLMFAAYSLGQFFAEPFWGRLSDRIGRKPVLLITLALNAVGYLMLAFAPNIWAAIAIRLFTGLGAGNISTVQGYVADVTPPDQRAGRMGMIGAAFGLGFIVGPLVGGLLGGIDLRLPFWGAAVLALTNFAYGLFVLPESLPPEKRAPRFDWSQAKPLASVALVRRYPQIADLIVVMLLATSTHYVYQSTFVLYGDVRYGWGPTGVSYVLAVVGVLSVIVNAGLVGRIIKRLGEQRALSFGLACGVVGFAIYGFAASPWLFYVGLPISALWAVSQPAAQALMTREVGADAQGRLQGAIMSLVSLTGIVAPMMYASTFGFFIGKRAPVYMPGAAFFLAAMVLACAWFLAVRHSRRAATVEPATA